MKINKMKLFKEISYKLLSTKKYLEFLYYMVYHRKPNFFNPQRFSEKIYCLKTLNQTRHLELIRTCYDKYTVREYIENKLGNTDILNECYGIYSKAEDIDFNALPDSFVLKITQSSGYNIICPNKNLLNIQECIEKLNSWLAIVNEKKNNAAEEEYYYTGYAKIICEKFLCDDDGNIPEDIRVYCFNGMPRLYVCDFGTTNNNGSHGHDIIRNVYDLEWNLLNVDLGRPHSDKVIMHKPQNIQEIYNIAKALSEDFEFVRVDLYNLKGKIVFGELTWIPMGGNCIISPDEFDITMGSWLDISDME